MKGSKYTVNEVFSSFVTQDGSYLSNRKILGELSRQRTLSRIHGLERTSAKILVTVICI